MDKLDSAISKLSVGSNINYGTAQSPATAGPAGQSTSGQQKQETIQLNKTYLLSPLGFLAVSQILYDILFCGLAGTSISFSGYDQNAAVGTSQTSWKLGYASDLGPFCQPQKCSDGIKMLQANGQGFVLFVGSISCIVGFAHYISFGLNLHNATYKLPWAAVGFIYRIIISILYLIAFSVEAWYANGYGRKEQLAKLDANLDPWKAASFFGCLSLCIHIIHLLVAWKQKKPPRAS